MLERHDIQGIVLSGYGHLAHAAFTFLQITDSSAAAGWISSLMPQVTTAAERKREEKPPTALNIAFTYAGIQALGLPDDSLQSFPVEFQEGMAFGERPRILGDTGESAPENWEIGGPNPNNPPLHALLLYYTSTREDALAWCAKLCQEVKGCNVIVSQYSDRSSATEPFGFRDGISQPPVEGVDHTHNGDEKPIKVGEFVLGYENEYMNLPETPTVDAGMAGNRLPEAVNFAGRRDLGRNGSYLVYRKLAQDVEGFWSFVNGQAKNADGTANPERADWIAAKMVGRWKSGVPLVVSPDKDDPALANDSSKLTSFLYAATDQNGEACPHGAHIRRTNPRDSLVPNPPTSLEVVRRHRIMRRGRPGEEGGKAGIYFLVINADIERQFEFVQQTWVNSPKFDGLYNNKDPLGGDNDGTGEMVIPACPYRVRVAGIPRFVQVKGGEYFFVPGMKALKFLLELKGAS